MSVGGLDNRKPPIGGELCMFALPRVAWTWPRPRSWKRLCVRLTAALEGQKKRDKICLRKTVVASRQDGRATDRAPQLNYRTSMLNNNLASTTQNCVP